MMAADPYQTLGVARNADEAEIKKAYRKLAQQHHPDANRGDANAEERFKEISGAYDVLGDPEKRKKYDELGPNWKQGAEFRPPPGWEQGGFRAHTRGQQCRLDAQPRRGRLGGGATQRDPVARVGSR